MPVRLSLRGESYAYDAPIELAGVPYTAFLRWNWRSADWRLSLQRVSDGVYVLTSWRLSPGAAHQIDGGQLNVYGVDPYDRRDLGTRLQLWWATDDDLADVTALGPRDPDFNLVE